MINILNHFKTVKIEHYRFAYDMAMALLASTIVISLFLQNRSDLSKEQINLINQIDYAVWLIFVADYLTRLILAEHKIKFIRSNVIDLISIIPVDVVFQGLRIIRVIKVARALRLFYMFRVFIYLNRLYKKLGNLLTTNNFHHVLWLTFSTIFGGAIAISYIEDMEIGDALWWSFVTTTTVGYGDIAPASLGGRIVAVFLMIIGIGFLSMLTGTIATYFIQTQKKSNYSNEVIEGITSKLHDFDNLSIDDINDMHAVLISLKKNHQKNK